MSIRCPLGLLALALLLVDAVGCRPRVELTDRSEWTDSLKDFVESSDLPANEVDAIEAVLVGYGDGWFLRMPRTKNTEKMVTEKWVAVEESPLGASAQEAFWQNIPKAWKQQRGDQAGKIYIHPRYNGDEDGNGTAFMGLIDDDYVYVWFYFNF